MTDRIDDTDLEGKPAEVNPGYALGQIAKALATCQEHENLATKKRAEDKIEKWKAVFTNIVEGSVSYGSRTPIKDIPEWATLEVITGGFATGELLADGPLQQHELELVKRLKIESQNSERLNLNLYYLTDDGISELIDMLKTGCYDIRAPEEGALLVVAWLVDNGHSEDARKLLELLSKYFNKLRFYPIPTEQPQQFGQRVYLQNVSNTIKDLERIKPNKNILAQKEAIETWAPYYDGVISLFYETFDNDWPCRKYPVGWVERASAHIAQYENLRKDHNLCGKPERSNGHFYQLRNYLKQCSSEPDSLTGNDVGRIRHIIKQYIDKRGIPGSSENKEIRENQKKYASGPTFQEIAGLVVKRLKLYPKNDGIDDLSQVISPIRDDECNTTDIPVGIAIPVSVQRKVERCLKEAVSELVEYGIITSGDTLARVLPQMTSGIRACGISDPDLRKLYSTIYRSFTLRRSLLLLNLEKQVQIEELPWVQAIERYRTENISGRSLAAQVLEEISILALTSFPYAIMPNKLLQEVRALFKSADMDVPIVDEIAADIFMGEFSNKFLESAKIAAGLLNGKLYANYYGIDYEDILNLKASDKVKKRFWQRENSDTVTGNFASLCSSRAGVTIGSWDPAINGMIIEQQQILTTQNLAALFSAFNLKNLLASQLLDMAKKCFTWICKRQQMKIDNWHGRLIMVKNTAYGWRQMIFYLSMLSKNEIAKFIDWSESHLAGQNYEYQNRFRPAIKGLRHTAEIGKINTEVTEKSDVCCFLGWSKDRHWLLTRNKN